MSIHGVPGAPIPSRDVFCSWHSTRIPNKSTYDNIAVIFDDAGYFIFDGSPPKAIPPVLVALSAGFSTVIELEHFLGELLALRGIEALVGGVIAGGLVTGPRSFFQLTRTGSVLR